MAAISLPTTTKQFIRILGNKKTSAHATRGHFLYKLLFKFHISVLNKNNLAKYLVKYKGKNSREYEANEDKTNPAKNCNLTGISV